MKPHPRIRKTVKWGGAVVTTLLIVTWIGTGWFGVAWAGGGGYWLALAGGSAQAQFYPPVFGTPEAAGWHFGAIDAPRVWQPQWVRKRYRWHLIVPLWTTIGLTAFVSALAFRLDTLARRRARLNLCPKCHYDRTGLASNANCPECGTPPASP